MATGGGTEVGGTSGSGGTGGSEAPWGENCEAWSPISIAWCGGDEYCAHMSTEDVEYFCDLEATVTDPCGQIRPWPNCRAQPADMTCGTDDDCRSKLDSYWRCVEARCERDSCTIDAECVDKYGEGWSCNGYYLCAED